MSEVYLFSAFCQIGGDPLRILFMIEKKNVILEIALMVISLSWPGEIQGQEAHMFSFLEQSDADHGVESFPFLFSPN